MKKLEPFDFSETIRPWTLYKLSETEQQVSALAGYVRRVSSTVNSLGTSIESIEATLDEVSPKVIREWISGLEVKLNNLEEDACANPASVKEIWDNIRALNSLIQALEYKAVKRIENLENRAAIADRDINNLAADFDRFKRETQKRQEGWNNDESPEADAV